MKIALPMITSGLRARLERRVGSGHLLGLQRGARAARRNAFLLHARRADPSIGRPDGRIRSPAPTRPARSRPATACQPRIATLAKRRHHSRIRPDAHQAVSSNLARCRAKRRHPVRHAWDAFGCRRDCGHAGAVTADRPSTQAGLADIACASGGVGRMDDVGTVWYPSTLRAGCGLRRPVEPEPFVAAIGALASRLWAQASCGAVDCGAEIGGAGRSA